MNNLHPDIQKAVNKFKRAIDTLEKAATLRNNANLWIDADPETLRLLRLADRINNFKN